jgi:hypothetical protein
MSRKSKKTQPAGTKPKRNNTKARPAGPLLAGLQEQVSALTRELAEAREQQTATLEVLHVISSSPGKLEPVFQAMLANAIRICDARFGSVYRCEGDALRFVAMHNAPPGFAELSRSTPFRPSPKHYFGPLERIPLKCTHCLRPSCPALLFSPGT